MFKCPEVLLKLHFNGIEYDELIKHYLCSSWNSMLMWERIFIQTLYYQEIKQFSEIAEELKNRWFRLHQ
jgi:hypothetical protein